jgi:hypothetical protein
MCRQTLREQSEGRTKVRFILPINLPNNSSRISIFRSGLRKGKNAPQNNPAREIQGLELCP